MLFIAHFNLYEHLSCRHRQTALLIFATFSSSPASKPNERHPDPLYYPGLFWPPDAHRQAYFAAYKRQ